MDVKRKATLAETVKGLFELEGISVTKNKITRIINKNEYYSFLKQHNLLPGILKIITENILKV